MMRGKHDSMARARRAAMAPTRAVRVCKIALLAGCIVISGTVTSPGSAYVRPAVTEMVSVSSSGAQGSEPDSILVAVQGCPSRCLSDVSANGRFVTFESEAEELVRNDGNKAADIFVRDRKAQTTERVSVSTDGSESIGICTPDPQDASGWSPTDPTTIPIGASVGSYGTSISSTGRYVVFSSCGANLADGDHKHTQDVFLHDRALGRTEAISVSSDEEGAFCLNGNRCSHIQTPQAVSANGRFVVFDSVADNLVAGDTNEMSDVFVRDRKTGETSRVSVTSDGDEAEPSAWPVRAGSRYGAISDDGRYVAFVSDSPNLGPGTNDNIWTDYVDVFVHDRKTGDTEQIDLVPGDPLPQEEEFTDGVSMEGQWVFDVALSPDGRFVAFTSRWNGFVPRDTNDAYDVFLHDRETGRKERISVTSTGGEAEAWSLGNLAVSRDGRFVSFTSAGTLDPDDTDSSKCGANNTARDLPCHLVSGDDPDVYVYDRITGSTDLISRNHDGGTTCGDSEGLSCNQNTWSGSLSHDGRHIVFQSDSPDLVEGTKSASRWEFFARDRGNVLGVGNVGDGPPPLTPPAPDPIVCLEGICIPPQSALSSYVSARSPRDSITKGGAGDLYGVSLAHRPRLEDLFARVELEHMPSIGLGAAALPSTPLMYGLRFRFEGRRYEVRATSLLGGTFGLFDCTTAAPACMEVGALEGGYGTTGMQVVFSIPLGELGLDSGGTLKDVEAFSAIGSYRTGVAEVLDRIQLWSRP